MKLHIMTSSLLAIGLLSGCGQDFQPLSSLNSSSSSKSGTVQPETVSSKILQDVGRSLQHSSDVGTVPALTEAQIAALIQSATLSLQNSGVSSSTDLQALLPIIIQKLTKSLADHQIKGTSPENAELIAAIGKSILSSVTQMNGATPPPELVALITKALFQNLPTAGITNGNLSTVAGGLMNSLVAHLGQQGIPTNLLTSLLQSASSGATLGIGNLNLRNLTSAQITEILRQIGQGSTQGLTRLSGISSNNELLQVLIEAVTYGAQSGLNQSGLNQNGVGVSISQLLASLITGQETGLSNSNLSDAKKRPLATFLQILLSRL